MANNLAKGTDNLELKEKAKGKLKVKLKCLEKGLGKYLLKLNQMKCSLKCLAKAMDILELTEKVTDKKPLMVKHSVKG